MGRVDDRSEEPRALIHKRILDVAEAKPDSTLDGIADEISAATPDLVDRVLEEYGDPAASDPESSEPESMSQNNDPDAISMNGHEPTTDSPSLTPKQRETLAAVRDRPTASQGVIADELGVTRATVSRRLNEIPDFEWTERKRFVERYFGADAVGVAGESDASSADSDLDQGQDGGEDGAVQGGVAREEDEVIHEEDEVKHAEGGEGDDDGDDSSTTAESGGAVGDQQLDTVPVESLEARLAAIEEQVTEMHDQRGSDRLDSDLVHKVVHACMESDVVTSEEELAVIEYLMT